jgi:N-acetyl-beta-hexosaminidase
MNAKQKIATEIHKIFISTFVEQGEEEAKTQYQLMIQALKIGSSEEEINQLANLAVESAQEALPEMFVEQISELWQEIL